MRIERYQSYKDSEIEWLEEVPEQWSLSRIKSLTKTKSGTTPQSGLSQYYDNGTHFWIRTTDLNNGKLHSSEFKVTDLAREHYNLTSIPVRSVLLAMYGGMGTIGKNAILQEEVTINQSVCAILPKDKKFVSEYLWYYIQYFRPHWEIFADSARKDPNINQEAIKRLWVTLPSLPEQKTIAHYLDTKTAQIDRKIDLLTQKATLYGNLKQSLINKTVTRGLGKSVPIKDSDYEWDQRIPENWQGERVKNIFKLVTDLAPSDNEFELLSLYTSIGVKPRKDMEQRGNKSVTTDGYWMVKKGDIIVNKLLAWMGAIGLSEYDGVTSPAYDILRKSSKGTDQRFYTYLFRTEKAQAIFKKQSRGIMDVRLRLYFDKFGAISVPFPPPEEQKAIADYLDTKTAQIDQIIQTINTQIGKLKELRKTLINDVVTGKIKVVENEY